MSVASAPPVLQRPLAKLAGFGRSATPSSLLRRWKSLGMEAGLVFAGQAAAGLGALIGVRVLTGLLSPAAFGEFALSLTLVTIIQYCYAGTSAAAMRFFLPAAEAGQRAAYLRAAWRLQHRRGLFVIGLTALGVSYLVVAGYTHLLPSAAAALAIAVISSYGMFMDGLQSADRQRAVVALHQGANALLRLGGAVLFAAWMGASAASVLWGFALGAVLTVGSQFAFYRRIRRSITAAAVPTDSQVLRQRWQVTMTDYAWPYVIWSIPAWFQFAADRWALDWFSSSIEVGVYAAFYQLAFLPINTLSQLATQFIMPILFARAGDLSDPQRVANSRSLNRKLVLLLGMWMLLSVGAAFVLRDPLGRLFLDVRYLASVHLLPWFVLSAGLFATAQLLELNITTLNRTALLIRPKIAISFLACVAYLVGAHSFGIAGVIWAGILAKAGFLVWLLQIDHRLAHSKENSLA